MLYHLVIEGGAFIELTDGAPLELRPGDVVIFPHGDAHHMSSGKGAIRPFPNYGINAKIKARDLNAADLEAAVKIIAGSARSMGLDVEG